MILTHGDERRNALDSKTRQFFDRAQDAGAGAYFASQAGMGSSGPKAVFVVDDDCNVRTALARLLSSYGHTVIEAEDGLDAWEKMRGRHTDIVISDLQMPHCDGRELCRRIRAQPEMRHVRIAIVTGGELPERCEVDCDVLVRKPVFVHTLLAELERLSSETVGV
jgi:CheY-like chemotaxis protein